MDDNTLQTMSTEMDDIVNTFGSDENAYGVDWSEISTEIEGRII